MGKNYTKTFHGKGRGKKGNMKKEVISIVRKEIDKELERKQIVSNSNAEPFINTPGSLTQINPTFPTQGVDPTDRVGDAIRLKTFKCMIDVNTSGGTVVPNFCRIIIFIDRYSQGAAAVNEADFFYNSNNSPQLQFNITHIGPQSDHRFIILHDKYFDIVPFIQGVAASNVIKKHFNYIKHWKDGLLVKFNNSNTGFDTDVESNLIKVWLLSDNSLNIPQANVTWDLEYTDA